MIPQFADLGDDDFFSPKIYRVQNRKPTVFNQKVTGPHKSMGIILKYLLVSKKVIIKLVIP